MLITIGVLIGGIFLLWFSYALWTGQLPDIVRSDPWDPLWWQAAIPAAVGIVVIFKAIRTLAS